MKTFAASLLIVFALFSSQARAAGPYDGIWLVTYPGGFTAYYSAHERDGRLVAISLGGDQYWEAFIGQRSGNTVALATLISGVSFQGTVTFTSDTTFTGQQISCVPQVPGWTCDLPNGAIFQGIRIW